MIVETAGHATAAVPGIVRRESRWVYRKLSASEPSPINWPDANTKVAGFRHTASDEDSYVLDPDHNYVAGTDLEIHFHWGPSTSDAGDVKWYAYVTWAEIDGVFPAGTLYSVVDTASGVPYTNQYASITIPGVGHTYLSNVICRIFRVGTDVADTYQATAGLVNFSGHHWANITQAGA